MKLWPNFYHGPRQAIRVLRRNGFNLSVGGTPLSQHRTVQGAVLAAQAHADQQDVKAIYRIRVDGGLYLEIEVMPRSDVTIRFSNPGDPGVNAFIAGAVIGATIASISMEPTTVVVHEHTYYYSEGVYLEKSGSEYIVIGAPVGAVISDLPPGHSVIHVQNSPYYFVAKKTEKPTYTVVSAPIGAIVEYLPKGTTERTVQGKKYLIYHGDWSQPFKSGSEVVYKVVAPPYGVTVSELPDGATRKTVKGVKYFVQNGVWYKAFHSGDQAIYKIVKNPEV